MKRNKFIVSMLATSVATISINVNSKLKKKGFKVKAGESRIHRHIKLKGVNSNVLDVKISGKDTYMKVNLLWRNNRYRSNVV